MELVGPTIDKSNKSDRLTLAYERLTEIPKSIVDKYADTVVTLDISHNLITNLDVLVYFKRLTSLIVDNNPITEACILPPIPSLQLLWFNHCRISSLYPWLENLKESCPNLKYLCLMGNPAAPSYLNGGTFYEYLQYRLFVISQYPQLHHLDDRLVTDDQRKEAMRMYKRPFLERVFWNNVMPSKLTTNESSWDHFKNRFAGERARKSKASARNVIV